jgi:HTH-type transcriptional regulator/antitoxin HigA
MLQTHMQFNSDNEYEPDIVSSPGDTLQEVLDDRHMTQTELAERIGLAHKTVNEIIRGKAPLTHETALALETVLGIAARFWNASETDYRESLARREGAQKLSDAASWLDNLPWRKAEKEGWISLQPSRGRQMLEVLRFFGVASPKQYEEVYGRMAVQWKRSARFVIDEHATAFWLRQGEIEANGLANDLGLVWNDYDPRRFEQCLQEARALTQDREPRTFVPELQRQCALAGVAVVFVRALEGTHVAGATRWLSPVRALIQLSVRHKTHDAVWFYFYHEAAHVLKHSKRRLFMETDEREPDDPEEREADEFAQNLLISPRDFAAFRGEGRPDKASIEAFAQRIGVDPGIVVGRLQNENLIKRDYANDLKQRYTF